MCFQRTCSPRWVHPPLIVNQGRLTAIWIQSLLRTAREGLIIQNQAPFPLRGQGLGFILTPRIALHLQTTTTIKELLVNFWENPWILSLRLTFWAWMFVFKNVWKTWSELWTRPTAKDGLSLKNLNLASKRLNSFSAEGPTAKRMRRASQSPLSNFGIVMPITFKKYSLPRNISETQLENLPPIKESPNFKGSVSQIEPGKSWNLTLRKN